MPKAKIPLVDEILWSDDLTAYDKAHFTLYVQLMDAVSAGALMDEMCEKLLHIDPFRERERAHKCLESHLKRARWFTADGFRHLIDRPSKIEHHNNNSR